MKCPPPESFINIHLIRAEPHACLQESKGGFNNQAIQQIADRVDDQWGCGCNSSLL